MTSIAVTLIGAGGHAKVVLSTLLAAGYRVTHVLDDDTSRWGTDLYGVPVRGPIELAEGPCVPGIGANEIRKKLAQNLCRVEWITVVHPTAWVAPTSRLGPGTVIFAGAVIQPDAMIGAHTIVNTGATIDHDCHLGDFVHVAPGCHLAGHVTLEEGVFMGIGSSVIPGVQIGAWTTVGAGGVVITDLPAHSIATGVPARVLRRKDTST